jgi:hypothetical protein
VRGVAVPGTKTVDVLKDCSDDRSWLESSVSLDTATFDKLLGFIGSLTCIFNGATLRPSSISELALLLFDRNGTNSGALAFSLDPYNTLDIAVFKHASQLCIAAG